VTGLIAAELLKIRTARSSFVVCIVAVAFTALFGLVAATANHFDDPPGEVMTAVGQFSLLFTLVLGVMAIAGENRNGTVSATLVVTPSRSRVIVAKLIAVGTVGFLIGLLAYGACLAEGALLLPGRGFELGFSGAEVARAVLGGAAIAAIYAAMGLGAGALLRNQTAAIVIVLVFLFFVDPLLAAIFDGYATYSLGALLPTAAGAPSQSPIDDPVSQGAALALSALYAGVLVALGLAAFEHAEITD